MCGEVTKELLLAPWCYPGMDAKALLFELVLRKKLFVA